MSRILMISGNAGLLEMAGEVLRGEFSDFDYLHCLETMDSRDIAAAVMACAPDVVIARGSRATQIMGMHLPVTVVQIPVTTHEMATMLEEASQYGRRIGLVSYSDYFADFCRLSSLMHLDIRFCPLEGEEPVPEFVRRTFAGGVDVIAGWTPAVTAARQLGLPALGLPFSSASLLRAAREARHVAAGIVQEKTRSAIARAYLDYSHGGVITVGRENRILFINPAAQRLLGLLGSHVTGRDADTVLPSLGLGTVLRSGREEHNALLKIVDRSCICTKVPVRVNDQIIGAVATFHDVQNIQKLEARIRTRPDSAGHVAVKTFAAIQCRSPALKRVVGTAKEFALTDSSVMLQGETGTGKELFAQSIHNYSGRSRGPFVAVNCAALPPQLLESELFGYERGAFTGANPKGKPGLFELAHGGTLLLDEISEMDRSVQGKFLRVLQERQIMRLGSDRVIPVDVRIITASNVNLRDMVSRNAFRSDLYYRLNVLKLRLPPLRECPEDIGALAALFLRSHAGKEGARGRLTPEAVRTLTQHHWPGNVRELQNFMERLAVMHGSEDIRGEIVRTLLAEDMGSVPAGGHGGQDDADMHEILRALACTNGNYTQAARVLGISRITLWRKLKQHPRVHNAISK